ncbi:hypothetical protein [Pseudonocardia sp.]|uniref:hypothetical protein n=1 Tax=Pseudonocardia sp. TaxID=60912 RepID=UPI003D0AD425
MSTSAERLFALLPAVHRLRDAAAGGPLRALLLVLERELAALESAAESGWDDWFIETCAESLAPYLGDVLGLARLSGGPASGVPQRGYVANALFRTRRSGTTAALERLARDVTGYPAHAAEQMWLTAATPQLNHRGGSPPPAPARSVDLRDPGPLDRINRAFDAFAHTPDVRPLTEGAFRPNLPNITLHLWRAQPQQVTRASARPVTGAEGWYTFDPLGAQIPLFHLPEPAADTGARAHGSRALRRTELAALPRGADPPVAVRLRRTGDAAPADEVPLTVAARNLADRGGQRPPERPPPGTAWVDPELGALVLAAEDTAADEVLVDYVQGAPGLLGAGPFSRSASWRAQRGDDRVQVQFGVARDAAGAGPHLRASLEDAVKDWNSWIASVPRERRATAVGTIVVTDSRRHAAPTTAVQVPDGARLFVVAGRRPAGGGPGEVVPDQVRPQVAGTVTVVGGSSDKAARPGAAGFNGLLVDGQIVVGEGALDRLELVHCTVAGGVTVQKGADAATNAGLTVDLTRTVLLGPVRAVSPAGPPRVTVTALRATESVLLRTAVDLPGATLELRRCTVLGTLKGRTLLADECLLDPVDVRASGNEDLYEIGTRQQGFVRYSYLPDAPKSPRRYRCQPDLAVADLDPADQPVAKARLRPSFESETLGQPGFLVLSPSAPIELRTTAADGGEPGVWHHLGHTQRMANLNAALRHDLRFGLAAGAVFER